MLLTIALILWVAAVAWFVVARAYFRARDRDWRTRIDRPEYELGFDRA